MSDAKFDWAAPRRVLVVAPPSPGYVLKALAHAADHGDAPLAADPAAGAGAAGLVWLPVAHVVALYVDLGITSEMAEVAAAARAMGIDSEYRTVNAERWAHALLDLTRAPVADPAVPA